MARLIRPWPSGPNCQLPRTVAPFRAETVVSYLARLAHANHLSPQQLRRYVAGRAGGYPHVDWLATASGQPQQVLRSRLRGLFAGDRDFTRQTYQSRPMCRFCMARRGIREPVCCWLPVHVMVCHHHRRWIGPPARTLDDQKDLHNHPQVLDAARNHGALVRRYGTERSLSAVRDARHILIYWANAEQSAKAPILDTTLAGHIGAYPDLVGVASLLVAHRDDVQQRVIREGIDWATYLLRHINHRMGQFHADPQPLQEWVNYQRLVATRGTAPAARGSKTTHEACQNTYFVGRTSPVKQTTTGA
jgi:hypothetical protein